MIYVTGDTHGRFGRIVEFCKKNKTTRDDVLVILGDAGVNYSGRCRDEVAKQLLNGLDITLLCIHGNHENRPWNLPGYEIVDWRGGKVYVDPKYPNILFAKDASVFDLEGRSCLVCGGAYSVSKFIILKYALTWGHRWFHDEQPSEEIKREVEERIRELGGEVDFVFTHTCPYRYRPTETYYTYIEDSTVDYSTEHWLDTIDDMLTYERWFCGHYHTNKVHDKMRFMADDIIELDSGK